jgi:hypothetical protein
MIYTASDPMLGDRSLFTKLFVALTFLEAALNSGALSSAHRIWSISTVLLLDQHHILTDFVLEWAFADIVLKVVSKMLKAMLGSQKRESTAPARDERSQNHGTDTRYKV